MTLNQDMRQLLLPVQPISPSDPIEAVAELFLAEANRFLLSLPIIEQGRPVGVISRYELMKVYLQKYGRELYGKQEIATLMNKQPLLVEGDSTVEQASQYITANIRFPITEDFIITQQGVYLGVGIVLDLLKMLEKRLTQRSHDLSKAYRNLKESQAQLVQSEKMASLGQLVAGIAHEINTPLGYVRNNVEVTQDMFSQTREVLNASFKLVEMLSAEQVDDGELSAQFALVATLSEPFQTEELFQSIEDLFKDSLFGVDQVAELVRGLKDFSRLDRVKTDQVNLNECLGSTLLIAKNLLKHKVTVKKQYGELPPLTCAPSQLNQVFLNLIVNATQAIPEQGVIILKTWADAEWVYVSVQDNGKGMSKDTMAQIFDPFFTTKPVGEGTGLGLSISYKIIQSHQGRIRVNSAVGQGTKFVISLPRHTSTTTLKQVSA